MLHYLQLLLYYLVEGSSFDREESVSDHLLILPPHYRLQTHPERHSRHYFQQDTAQRPHIDDPGVIVFLDIFQQLRNVLEFVLVKYEIEDLRSHVLRCGHWKLSQIVENKRTAIINQFRLKNMTLFWILLNFLLSFQFYKNVLSFKIRMYYIIFR